MNQNETKIREQILALLSRKDYRPLNKIEIATELGVSGKARVALRRTLRDIERAGEIARIRRVARGLAAVCFNGNTAARAQPAWAAAGYATLVLPSTSPAYTRPIAEKLAAWRELRRFLEDD